jgi:hypothetical protein
MPIPKALHRQLNETKTGNPVWGTGNQGAAASWRGVGCPHTLFFLKVGRRPTKIIMSGCQILAIDIHELPRYDVLVLKLTKMAKVFL